MMPLPDRYLTALILRCQGMSTLVDVGEGTQVALRAAGWSVKPIDTILITHLHADHVSGLPGLLLTMGNAERKESVKIYGPRGTRKAVTSLLVIAPDLPFEVEVEEWENDREERVLPNGLIVHAFRVKHRVPCYGYSFRLPRAGRFSVERAKEAGVPLKLWNRLQKGEEVLQDGILYTPDMVLGPERKGLHILYSTDTRPVPAIPEEGRNADLMILEGLYGDDEKMDKVRASRHMIFEEAAYLAKEAGAKELWLTHFSPALVYPEAFLKKTRKIFPNTELGANGKECTLTFEEDDHE